MYVHPLFIKRKGENSMFLLLHNNNLLHNTLTLWLRASGGWIHSIVIVFKAALLCCVMHSCRGVNGLLGCDVVIYYCFPNKVKYRFGCFKSEHSTHMLYLCWELLVAVILPLVHNGCKAMCLYTLQYLGLNSINELYKCVCQRSPVLQLRQPCCLYMQCKYILIGTIYIIL